MNIFRWKNSAQRWVSVILAILVPAGVMAAITLPKTFMNGTTIVADDVNANFNALASSLPIITEWQNYTPNLRIRLDGQSDGQVSNTPPVNLTATGKFRRVGQDIEVQLSIGSTGLSNSVSGSNWLEVSLPSNLGASGTLAGSCGFWDGSRFWTGVTAQDDAIGHWYRLDFGQPFTGPAIGRLSTVHIRGAGNGISASLKTQVSGWTVSGP